MPLDIWLTSMSVFHEFLHFCSLFQSGEDAVLPSREARMQSIVFQNFCYETRMYKKRLMIRVKATAFHPGSRDILPCDLQPV